MSHKNDSLPCGAIAIHSADGMQTNGITAQSNGAPTNQMRVDAVIVRDVA
jgi:hypothetical protein